MKVALYVRARVDNQEVQTLKEILEQLEQLTCWTNEQGHQIVRIYGDPRRSANDEHRPGFQKILEDALSEPHHFAAIVVREYSRLFRDCRKLADFEKNLFEAGVKLSSATRPELEEVDFAKALKFFSYLRFIR